MEEMIRVGYARQAVTPDESIPLTGYSNEPKRFHKEIAQEICVTCVAISDTDDTTILMIGMDVCTIPEHFMKALDGISAEVGVPKDRIYMSATHTHAAPGVGHIHRFEEAKRYSDKYLAATLQVYKEALADRKPAQMYTGSIETSNMNFVKHYKSEHKVTKEICYVGDCYGNGNDVIYLEHATLADPTMHVVKFEREGGKDVVVANFRAHPHFDGGSKVYKLSSDYIGAFRKALEAMVDCHAVYFRGACGNINSSSRLPAERRYTTAVSYGLGLAGFCTECLAKRMTKVEAGKIKTKQMTFYGEINRTMDHLAPIAKELREQWNIDFDTAKLKERALPLGIHSQFHAGAIWWNSVRTKEKDGWIILNAVCLGDSFAFVTFPGEMYDSVSVRMEENSPFYTTMMLGYCYHHLGYLPSAAAYKYGAYEVDITRFSPGTGEMVADTQVQLLKDLKNQ